MAVRAFGDIVNDPRTMINKHPADFTLVSVGEVDDAVGVLRPLAEIRPVCTAASLFKPVSPLERMGQMLKPRDGKLNGDIAGVTARSIFNTNEWNSPAGFNRGSVKNVTRLAVNPNKSQRDLLFPNSVNFVVSFPNSGPILFSDKTLLDRPSDFDAIGIRLLFILMEKSIATSARFLLS